MRAILIAITLAACSSTTDPTPAEHAEPICLVLTDPLGNERTECFEPDPCPRLCALIVDAACSVAPEAGCVEQCRTDLETDRCPREAEAAASCTADHAVAWCADDGAARAKDDSAACLDVVRLHAEC